jgi:hypothetical protein
MLCSTDDKEHLRDIYVSEDNEGLRGPDDIR